MKEQYLFSKEFSDDKIWIVERLQDNKIIQVADEYLFSFDKKIIFNFWKDYPDNLTKEQADIFKDKFPMLAELK